jgi:hypothetical protein
MAKSRTAYGPHTYHGKQPSGSSNNRPHGLAAACCGPHALLWPLPVSADGAISLQGQWMALQLLHNNQSYLWLAAQAHGACSGGLALRPARSCAERAAAAGPVQVATAILIMTSRGCCNARESRP